jgi:hypothetical protein
MSLDWLLRQLRYVTGAPKTDTEVKIGGGKKRVWRYLKEEGQSGKKS